MAVERLINIVFQAIGMTTVLGGLSKASDLHEDMERNSRKVAENIEKQQKEMNDAKDALKGISGATSDIVNKFDDMKERLEATETLIDRAGGVFENLKTRSIAFAETFGSARKQGTGMFGSLLQGADSFNLALGQGSKIINASFVKIGAVVAGLAPIILTVIGAVAAISAAWFTMKRMFDLNVGGMASRWFKFVGRVKNLIGQLEASFNRALMKLGPLLDITLGIAFDQLNGVLNVTIGLFKGIGYALDPLFEAFSEIGKAFKEIFGIEGQSNLKVYASLGNAVGKIFEALGKIIGWVVKVGLMPLVDGLKAVGGLVTILKTSTEKLIDNLMGLKPVQIVVNGIANIFDQLKKSIMGLLENPIIKKIIEAFAGGEEKTFKISSEDVIARARESGATVNNKSSVVNKNFQNNITLQNNSRNGTEDALQIKALLGRQMML